MQERTASMPREAGDGTLTGTPIRPAGYPATIPCTDSVRVSPVDIPEVGPQEIGRTPNL
jgi:hypothetical protein